MIVIQITYWFFTLNINTDKFIIKCILKTLNNNEEQYTNNLRTNDHKTKNYQKITRGKKILI